MLIAFQSRRIKPAFIDPYLETKGIGPGGWYDLDKPATLEYVKLLTGATNVSQLIGARTTYPFGFAAEQMMRMFYDVKNLQIAVPFAGATNGLTKVTRASSSAPLPESEPVETLLYAPYGHSAAWMLETGFFFILEPNGYFFGNQFYPFLLFSTDWHKTIPHDEGDEDDELITGVIGSSSSDGREVGALTFWGYTTPLYELFDIPEEDGEGGNVEVTVSAFR